MTSPLADARALSVEFLDPGALLDLLSRPDTLAVFGFGTHAQRSDDPRHLRVPLEALGKARIELWRSMSTVTHGIDGAASDGLIRHAEDGALQFASIEIAEGDDGILAASERAYARAARFWKQSAYPHLLRIWNYLDAIVEGAGDAERYRQFCIGRVRGLGGIDTTRLPAATAIGSRDGRRIVQVYWLAAREAGTPLENPRQVSAYRYPRQYGPQSPSFARALLPAGELPLLLSGTASIVGHASQHVDDLHAQIDETLRNLDALLGAARERHGALPAHFDAGSRLKVYVRDADDAPLVERRLRERLGAAVPLLLLHGDVCRRELAVEIEGMHGLAAHA